MNFSELTDAQAAGQRLMAGFDGTDLNAELKRLIDTLLVGGVILFSRNIVDPNQLQALCRSIQEWARKAGQPPLFIAIDQEGGKVARLKPPFTQFPGNPHMKDESDAEAFARITASELTGMGINMDMAPVLDVAPQEGESVMADRVFGCDPEQVARMGCRVIEVLQNNGIMAVAKHFPGIGRTLLDSHLDLPTLEATPAELEAFELPPFAAAIRNGVAGMMLSHIRYSGLDAEWPASLSIAVARDLLRERMGYDGLVLTDDLDMGAIHNYFDTRIVIKRVLQAEIDIALICHAGPAIQTACDEILENWHTEDLHLKNRACVERILRMKRTYLRAV
ncbi:MAG: beta-N-acetylhexosaminidase [Thermodesulfobacteriota bacterium]